MHALRRFVYQTYLLRRLAGGSALGILVANDTDCLQCTGPHIEH